MTCTADLESPLPAKVLKRDGTVTEFDSEKIYRAILNAGLATREFMEDEARGLADQVCRLAGFRFGGIRENRTMPGVEQVQDMVEQVLASSGHFTTAKAYIIYREHHKHLRDDRKTLLDVGASVEEYLEQADWRVKANANQGYSLAA